VQGVPGNVLLTELSTTPPLQARASLADPSRDQASRVLASCAVGQESIKIDTSDGLIPAPSMGAVAKVRPFVNDNCASSIWTRGVVAGLQVGSGLTAPAFSSAFRFGAQVDEPGPYPSLAQARRQLTVIVGPACGWPQRQRECDW
jgi:hypothetical protein